MLLELYKKAPTNIAIHPKFHTESINGFAPIGIAARTKVLVTRSA